MNNQHTDIDPITLAVVEGTLASAIREMGIVMRRTVRSPVLAIGNDFSNGIFDGQPMLLGCFKVESELEDFAHLANRIPLYRHCAAGKLCR